MEGLSLVVDELLHLPSFQRLVGSRQIRQSRDEDETGGSGSRNLRVS